MQQHNSAAPTVQNRVGPGLVKFGMNVSRPTRGVLHQPMTLIVIESRAFCIRMISCGDIRTTRSWNSDFLRETAVLKSASLHFKASGCLDSTPQNLLNGNLQPGWLCRCSMWARAPVQDSFNACTGPWQCLQRIISPRSVRASYKVHGSQRPRTLTSHSVITCGFVLVDIDG